MLWYGGNPVEVTLRHNVFPLISGGKVALNHLRPLPRFNATFPPDIKGKTLVGSKRRENSHMLEAHFNSISTLSIAERRERVFQTTAQSSLSLSLSLSGSFVPRLSARQVFKREPCRDSERKGEWAAQCWYSLLVEHDSKFVPVFICSMWTEHYDSLRRPFTKENANYKLHDCFMFLAAGE